MVIVVKDTVAAADTSEQGDLLLCRLKAEIGHGQRDLVISFKGITSATSSFINASFVELLSVMTLAEIRQNVRVINSTAQINDMIRRRLERESLVRV